MLNRRRFLVAVTLASATACDLPPDPQDRLPEIPQTIRVALIGAPPGDLQWPYIEGGARASAARFPWVELRAYSPLEPTRAAFLAAAKEAARTKPHAVCMWTPDKRTGAAAARRVISDGARLVTIGEPLELPEIFGHVDIDPSAAAELIGASLERIARGGRSYVLLHDNGRSEVAARVYQRFMSGSRRQHAMTLLAERNAAIRRQTGAELLAEMLGQFRHVSLVVSLMPDPWLAATGLAASPPGTVPFATLPAAPALWSAVRSGRCAALAGPVDGEIGRVALELALSSVTDPTARGGQRYVGCELVTAENLEAFSARYLAAAGVAPSSAPSEP